jgi:hypothetical protein
MAARRKSKKTENRVPKYRLELTAKQARLVSQACELIGRLGMGQVREIFDFLPLSKTLNYREYHADVDTICIHVAKHTIQGSGHLSISSPDTPEQAKEAIDIHKVIRNRLAWDAAVEKGIIANVYSERKWPEMMAVDYDNPTQRSAQALCKITKLD